MNPSKLPPQANIDLLKAIEKTLYSRCFNKLFNELTNIIVANSRIHNNTQNFLNYSGELFIYGESPKKFPRPINTVHSSIRGRLKTYISEKDELEREKGLALGYVQLVMLSTRSAEDYFLLLPESLHSLIRPMAHHLEQGEGKYAGELGEQFIAQNNKYISLMKARMVKSLLGLDA